jgi:broad specificity phosphatase PhoE
LSELLQIVVVRHAESKANAEARMQGRFDSPLSDRGRAQAAVLGAWLGRQSFRWDTALCSPLRRAHETAEIATREAGGKPAVVEPDLAEVRAGELEGLRADEIAERFPSYPARKLAELGDFSEYGGESYDAIQHRARDLTERLLASHSGQKLLLVGHGGFNYHFVKRLTCMPVPRVCSLSMENCTATLLRLRVRRGIRIAEVVWHVPLELLGAHVPVVHAPSPGAMTP